ncbi:amidohydrolase family protein, partial [Paracoccaceae bacterium]|nr:amidohydrolase family protein [Paracoccaceae bacterium]
ENSRTGFEAKADMLSITGMTLEQFADLMQGLGYQAAKAERVKTKAAQDPVASATPEVDKPEIAADLPEEVAFEPVDAVQEAASDVNLAKVEPSAAESLSSGSERTETLYHMLDSGKVWIKLSGLYRLANAPYFDTDKIVSKLVRANPERCLWGSDWPHIMLNGAEMPDAGSLMDAFYRVVSDEKTRDQILIENPIPIASVATR